MLYNRFLCDNSCESIHGNAKIMWWVMTCDQSKMILMDPISLERVSVTHWQCSARAQRLAGERENTIKTSADPCKTWIRRNWGLVDPIARFISILDLNDSIHWAKYFFLIIRTIRTRKKSSVFQLAVLTEMPRAARPLDHFAKKVHIRICVISQHCLKECDTDMYVCVCVCNWIWKAQTLGYPARSVFKLEQIDARHRVFRPGQKVLDLGSCPGDLTSSSSSPYLFVSSFNSFSTSFR